jgi:hypothetical protein
MPHTHYDLYDVVLSASGVVNILAQDNEHAAWTAMELSLDREEELIDVRRSDEW